MAKATGPVYDVPFRRRRRALTNYRKRLALVKSGRHRLVVRKSGKHVIVQLVAFNERGDTTTAMASSIELRKFGWPERSNLPTAYLAGALAGVRARERGVEEFVADIGLATASKGALVFAAVKGAVDAGLRTNFKEEMADPARVRGEHIAKYAELLKAQGGYDKQFADYIKAGIPPERIPEKFDEVKAAILKKGGSGTIGSEG